MVEKMETLRLIIVEDEEAHFQLMKRAIEKAIPSASIHHFSDPVACLERLDEIDPDIIVADYLMPGMNGIEFLEALNRDGRDVPTILVTGQGDERVAVQAMKLGAWDYLVKSPDGFALLPSVMEKAVRERMLREALRESCRLNELLLDSLPHPAMLIR
jgi:DNA-binding NtrC family response regulator